MGKERVKQSIKNFSNTQFLVLSTKNEIYKHFGLNLDFFEFFTLFNPFFTRGFTLFSKKIHKFLADVSRMQDDWISWDGALNQPYFFKILSSLQR